MNADVPPMNADDSGLKCDVEVKSHDFDCFAALKSSIKHSAFIGVASAFIGVQRCTPPAGGSEARGKVRKPA